MTDSPTLALSKAFIERPSVTPDDQGCMDLIVERLEPLGFKAEFMNFGEVRNLWIRKGDSGPLFAFAGHTDVVPTGPIEAWGSHPFKPEIRDGMLYGRGAADMKSSIAAFVVAVERFLAENQDHTGSIAMLITSDEEGPSVDGTVKVVQKLSLRQENIDWCLVGEPSSTSLIGDVVKNGRRGSHGAKLTVRGIQGHVAYPHLADNPIHKVAPAIHELAKTRWDEGNDHFPPTTFQISNINAGTGANNVIPGEVEIILNLRYSTETNHHRIEQRVAEVLDRHGLDYDIDWKLSGKPFLTPEGKLVDAVSGAIQSVTGRDTELSTAGGTSDGRFIAPTGAEVVELGPLNATIHKVDECVSVDDLETLTDIYQATLKHLLA
ncbi:MAG: succinyl-diaminopimelate desuccinylase [Gammaproteobacteria bacterium]